ncbi:hypothetical protein SMSP2_02631 [Limihaloglobus sulfuriphilus]|uniref:Uncharacterized protein n=1 Tax=Limihaloglobus sulfuriphilus TaxID=1851148 RepID=A0A1Q2MHT7_9BACT|nr:hypothetical protein [Limihaloglobus sulfuriphilus]AQQ72250.1 hypothetical protein SMSP2_02631 [Limihaloglobus sulfuriphilus]
MYKGRGQKALYEALGKSRGGLYRDGKPVRVSGRPGDDKKDHKKKKPRSRPLFSEVAIIKLVIGLIITIILVWILVSALRGCSETAEPKVSQEGTKETLSPSETDVSDEYSDESPEPIVARINADSKPDYMGSGSNVIVVVTYQVPGDLEPVKEYFAQNGIALHIVKRGKWYYLETVETFETVNTVGSTGYNVKEKIKKIGARYEAPAGYETFGTKPFQDVYGKKIR